MQEKRQKQERNAQRLQGKQQKIVVYTIITGDYDYLKEPEYEMENCDYICFTDNPDLRSRIWEIRYEAGAGADTTRWQRRRKILAHKYIPPDYEWCVYVDGNVRITGDLRHYIEQESAGAPILCLQHPNRDNVYEEALECIRLGKDDPKLIRSQMDHYRQEGFGSEHSLVVTNVLVRKHMDKDVIRLMELWWSQIETYSRRDQLSFNYACWKLGICYDVSKLKCWKSPYWQNPGIHTADIRKAEEELVAHIQLEAFMEYQIREKDAYIALKEQELKDAGIQLGWKEQERKDANTQLEWKQQELKDAQIQLGWKEQELKDANTRVEWKEQELKDAQIQLGWKEQELKDAQIQLGWKEQELKDANTRYGWKEQELKDAQIQLGWKEQELKDIRTQLEWKRKELDEIRNSASWKCTKFLRFAKAAVSRKRKGGRRNGNDG